ncbi:MAG: PAS domain S-box protein [Promethearchaeota archaeon]
MVKEDTKLDFQLIANLSVDVIFQLALNGDITYCSPSVEQMLGYRSDEVIGANFRNFMNPTDTSSAAEAFRQLISGEIIVNFEFQLLRKDNSPVQVEFSAAPVITQGTVVSIQGICRDISELKQVKEETRQSEERFYEFIEASPDGIAITDLDGTILMVNNYGATTLGYEDKEELIGKNGFDNLIPEDRTRALENVTHVLEAGRLDTTEYSLIKKDGSIFSVDMTVSTIKDADDNPVSFMVVIRDISDRIKLQKAVQESEIHTHQIIENIRDIVFTLSPEGYITSLNPAFEEITGLSLNEAIGKHFTSMIHPDTSSSALKAFKSIIQNKSTGTSEVLLKTKEDTYAIIEGRVTPQFDQGEIVSFFGVARDITKRKQAEEALRENEEMFRLLSEQSFLAICLVQDDRIKYVNQAFLDFVNLPSEEVLSWTRKEYSQFIHPDDRQVTLEQGRKKQIGEKEGVIPHYSLRIITLSGERRWIEVYSKTIDYKGKLANFVTFIDITERKRMEKSLRESEEQYRDILENIRDVVFTLTPDITISSVSPEFEKFTGYLCAERIGKSFMEIVHPDDIHSTTMGFKATLHGETPPPHETRIISKSGEIVTCEIKATPQVKDGDIVGCLGICRDITERKKAEEELIRTKKRLEYLLKSCPAVIYSCTPDGHFETTFMSENIEKILGHQADNFVHKPEFWEESIHPEDREHVIAAFSEITEKSYYSDEYRFKHKDGSYHWMLEEANLIPDDNGNPLEVVGFWTDITERKIVEEKLRQSEKQYRTLFENTPIGLYRSTPDNKFLTANPKFIKQVGLSSFKELCTISPNGLATQRNYPRDRFINEINKKGEVKGFESQFIRPDGTFTYIRENARAITDSDGSILYYEGSVEDITDRILAEKAVCESEEKFRSIFDSAPIGMALTDLDFQFTRVNKAITEMMGYSEEELIESSLPEITHLEDRINDLKFIEGFVNNEKPTYQTKKRYLKKDRKPFWARTTLSHLYNDKGEPINYLAMIEDITASVQLEEGWKQQLLKYDVTGGNIYLVTENTPVLSQTVFKDLIEVGYRGYIISRALEKDYHIPTKENYVFHHLNEKMDNEALLKIIEDTPNKSVILIDRIEYLFTNRGFEETMQLVYKLSETAYLKTSIIIISVDKLTLTERQMHILKKETKEIELRSLAALSEENLEILRLIYQQNNLGKKPSYSVIGKELEISRPTARKRIKHLVATGYLIERRKRNSKVLELTEKGKLLFLR